LPPLGQIRFGFTWLSRAENSQPDPVDNLNLEVRHTLHGAAKPANVQIMLIRLSHLGGVAPKAINRL
jgi:hypothetical protein